MSSRSIVSLLLAAAITSTLVAASGRARQARSVSFEPPGRDEVAHISGDTATLPNGRRVTPAGRVIRIQSYGWGIAVSPDGARAAVVHPDSIELADLAAPYAVRRLPPSRADKRPDLGAGTYMGAAFSPDGGAFTTAARARARSSRWTSRAAPSRGRSRSTGAASRTASPATWRSAATARRWSASI